MGANQSQNRQGARPSGSDPSGEQADALQSTDDLYAILQVNSDASSDEIKKAFRKQALIHHPDKNFDNVEKATKQFAKIQQAYEILSDEDERAFYDRHRDELLDTNHDDDFDPTQFKPSVPRSSRNPGMTTKQILKFFDSSLWKGDFSDSTTSFFTIYRSLFNQLAVEEKIARQDTTIIYPSFGTSESSYDQDIQGMRALKHFYSIWLNFSTQKSFEWIEPHHTNQQADRRIKRLMEKENQRERENARREYNETIRSLVSFVKKRDPRFASSTASNPEKWRTREIQRIKRELKEVAERRAKEREEEARQFREQAWQRQKDQEEAEDVESEDAQADSTGEDQLEDEVSEVAPNDWYCAACGKEFNSQGAWENHERSKKHRQNAQRLRKQMLKEDAELSLSTPVSRTERSSNTPEIAQGRQELPNKEIHRVNLEESLDKFNLNDDIPTENKPLEPAEESVSNRGGPDSLQSQTTNLENSDGEDDDKKPTDFTSKDDNDSDTTQAMTTRRRKKNKKTTKSGSMMSSRTGSDIDDEAVQESSFGNASNLHDQPVGIVSKKDKRRAKEAAKKLALQSQPGAGLAHYSLTCNVCDAKFDSKNKLFEHIKRFGHASAISQSTPAVSSTTTTRTQTPSKTKAKKKHTPPQEQH